jgi:predicted transposase YbfD/YdcC
VNAKSNEIPAVRDLLAAFADLAGAVITLEALHTQHDTAQLILGWHADYAMTVKGNMPTLFRQLKKLPWPRVPSVSTVTKDHGRCARRTVKVLLAPAWIEFEGAAQVAQLRRTVTKKGKKTVEVVYVITSDRRADPATLAAWVKGHWEIENRLHWVSSPTRRTSPWSGPGTRPASWRPCAAWPSASCGWAGTTTSPPPTGTTPAIPTGRSSYFKLRECDFAVSLGRSVLAERGFN